MEKIWSDDRRTFQALFQNKISAGTFITSSVERLVADHCLKREGYRNANIFGTVACEMLTNLGHGAVLVMNSSTMSVQRTDGMIFPQVEVICSKLRKALEENAVELNKLFCCGRRIVSSSDVSIYEDDYHDVHDPDHFCAFGAQIARHNGKGVCVLEVVHPPYDIHRDWNPNETPDATDLENLDKLGGRGRFLERAAAQSCSFREEDGVPHHWRTVLLLRGHGFADGKAVDYKIDDSDVPWILDDLKNRERAKLATVVEHDNCCNSCSVKQCSSNTH